MSNSSLAPLIIYFFLFISFTFCAPPNDDCTAATQLISGNIIIATNIDSRKDAGTTCVTTVDGGNVSYKFNSGNNNRVLISTCPTRTGDTQSTFDPKIYLYQGTCSNPVCMYGNDDFCRLDSEIEAAVAANTNYLVAFAGFSGAEGSSYLYFELSQHLPPSNDQCASAITVPSNGSVISGTLLGSTTDYLTTSCTPLSPTGGGNVWYRFNPGSNNRVAFSNCGYTYFPGQSGAIFSGTCGGYSCVVARIQASSIISCGTIDAALTSNADYLLSIDGYGPTIGSFSIQVQYYTVTNEDCPSATTLTTNGFYTGNLVGSTEDASPACVNPTPVKNVWYRFNSASNTRVLVSFCVSGTKSVAQQYVSLHTDICAKLKCARFTERTCPSGTDSEYLETSLTTNTNYYLNVFSTATATLRDFTFYFELGPPTTLTASATVTATATSTATATATSSATSTATATSTPTSTATPSPSASFTPSISDSISSGYTFSSSPTVSDSPSTTPSISLSNSPTSSSTLSAKPSTSPTSSISFTSTPSVTPSPPVSSTPTPTASTPPLPSESSKPMPSESSTTTALAAGTSSPSESMT